MKNFGLILKLRYKSIARSTGIMLFILSLMILGVGLTAFIYNDPMTFVSFAKAGVISLITSLIFYILGNDDELKRLNSQDAVMSVFLIWIFAAVYAALPFVFHGLLNIHQAIFESVSGWTTAGLTMFLKVEEIPKTFIIWRSWIQYIGGVGFALMMVIIAGPVGMGLYEAEGRSDNVVPNIRDSAKIIVTIYVTWTIIGIFLLMGISGWSFFDSFNHTMTALATGGFSTKNTSIMYYNDVGAESILMLLMIMGATGFGVHYAAVVMTKNYFKNRRLYKKGLINKLDLKERMKSEPFWKNPEPKTMFLILVVAWILMIIFSTTKLYGFSQAVRHTAFQAISAMTNTGFQTVDLTKWNPFGIFVLTILMILGGMMDSTASGLKTFRVYIIFELIKKRIVDFFKPVDTQFHVEVYKGVIKRRITEPVVREVLTYTYMYLFVYIVAVLVMTVYGYNLQDSLFEIASAQSAVGITVGVTQPTMPLGAMWTETIVMFLGRLEFFVIYWALIKLVRDAIEITKSAVKS